MRIARYGLAALLVLLLVASIGYDRWTERPYIVTGASLSDTPTFQWSVTYTLPQGGTGTSSFTGDIAAIEWSCFREARVGQRLPDCVRSGLLNNTTAPPPTPD